MTARTAAHAAKRQPIGRAPARRGPLAFTAHRAQAFVITITCTRIATVCFFFFLYKKASVWQSFGAVHCKYPNYLRFLGHGLLIWQDVWHISRPQAPWCRSGRRHAGAGGPGSRRHPNRPATAGGGEAREYGAPATGRRRRGKGRPRQTWPPCGGRGRRAAPRRPDADSGGLRRPQGSRRCLRGPPRDTEQATSGRTRPGMQRGPARLHPGRNGPPPVRCPVSVGAPWLDRGPPTGAKAASGAA